MPNTADTTEVVVICTLSSGALSFLLLLLPFRHPACPFLSYFCARVHFDDWRNVSAEKRAAFQSLWQRESKRCERLRRK